MSHIYCLNIEIKNYNGDFKIGVKRTGIMKLGLDIDSEHKMAMKIGAIINLASNNEKIKIFLVKKMKSLIKIKEVSYKKKNIVFNYLNQEIAVILYKDIDISEEGKGLKLTVNIEKLDLDGLLDNIADENFSNNILVRELIKTANSCLAEDKKLELIQSILPIINETNLADKMYCTYIENGGKVADQLKGMDLVLGDITLEK